MTKNIVVFIFVVLLSMVDQIIKVKILNSSAVYHIWGDFLNISLTKNFGVFASIPFNYSEVVVVFILALLIFSFKKYNFVSMFPYFLITLFGIISNLIDRIRYDFVIDYINFFNLSHFNIADLLIYIGCFGIIWKITKSNKLKIS